MSIYIKVNSCLECPYLKEHRAYYCSKKYKSESEARNNGNIWEWRPEFKEIPSWCPFNITKDCNLN